MPTQRLQQLLQQLKQELIQLDDENRDERLDLEALISEVEKALEQDDSEQHATMVDKLKARFIEFDSDHPTTSGIMRRLMQTLSDMGI